VAENTRRASSESEDKEMVKTTEKYLRYDEIKALIDEWAKAYPDLIEAESIGKSYEERDILLVILTNKKTGPHLTKPAIYIDGNHHAGEVTGSAVCLYTIEYLLENYVTQPDIKNLLDTKTFYILPRVSPDGSELYLTTPYTLRSSVRPYPDDDLGEGLVPDDIDGNGLILQMRWEDPAGQWKVSEKDSRAMVRRKPGDVGGKYFRVATEGLFQQFDGVEIKPARPRWSLDLNRNYPGNWHAANLQTGPGPFPLSEPETRAVADFFRAHPNIAMALSYHTSGGVILRPRTAGPDRDIPRSDLAMMTALGRKGTEITGYPCVSIFEGFTVDQRRPSTGSFLDFTYDVLGIMAFAVELWDLRGRAGIPRRDLRQQMNLSEDQQEEDELKILAFVDKELAGEGFYPWKPFQHPQLGPVEIGGFDPKFLRQNPPVKLLAQECHKNTLFSLMLAQALPEIRLFGTGSHSRQAATGLSRKIGDREYEFTCCLKNLGYLPTCSTQQSQTVRSVKPLKVRLTLTEGVSLLAGKPYEELPHLPGWGSAQGGFGLERRLSYVFKVGDSFKGPKLAHVKVESERAGTVALDILAPEGTNLS